MFFSWKFFIGLQKWEKIVATHFFLPFQNVYFEKALIFLNNHQNPNKMWFVATNIYINKIYEFEQNLRKSPTGHCENIWAGMTLGSL